MTFLLVYSLTLLAAVLISSLAERSIVSTAVLFLVAGFVCGPGVLGILQTNVNDPAVGQLSELALVSVLFTDGMRLGLKELRQAWRLAGSALVLGMPIAFGLSALVLKGLTDLSWTSALLVSAVLSPTDPVFAAAIVDRNDVPRRLRRLLSVESGFNDGIALPVVLVLLNLAGAPAATLTEIAGDVAGGIALGIIIPWVAIKLEESPLFESTPEYRPLNAIAIGLIVLSVASLTRANEFLAAFTAGIVLANQCPSIQEDFARFGEIAVDMLKFAALLVFGAAVSPSLFTSMPLQEYLFVLVLLFVIRPSSLLIALGRSRLTWKEWTVAAWFGPKGFASVFYGLLILKSGVESSHEIFRLTAVACVFSIVAHSSTDVVLARWLGPDEEQPQAGMTGQPSAS